MEHITLVPGQSHLDAELARDFRGGDNSIALQLQPVYTLSAWVRESASRINLLRGLPMAYSPDVQELRLLWERSIRRELEHLPDEESYALACQCVSAERLISQWSSRDAPAQGQGFRSWHQSVQKELKKRHWFTASDWFEQLVRQVNSGDFPQGVLPRVISLAGFVELTVLEERLFDVLGSQGVDIRIAEDGAGRPGTCNRSGFENIDDEVSAAVHWAGRKVAEGCDQVAIVVNELDRQAALIRRVLENAFHASETLAFQAGDDGLFMAPGDASLSAHPLVADALLLIRMAMHGRHHRHEFGDVSRLLLSGNWNGGKSERFERAQLEKRLRGLGQFRVSLPGIADLASGDKDHSVPGLLRDTIVSITEAVSGADPVERMISWLGLWGWPGESTHDQQSLACHQHFMAILEKLSRQGLADIRLAFRQLLRYCNEAKVPASGGVFSPIHVLTPEQAYGRFFNAVWVANLTVENWPPRPVTNPFTPASLAAKIPRATEEGMLAYTIRLSDHLRNCAPEVRFSWCHRFNDAPMSPSPLIEDLDLVNGSETISPELWHRVFPAASDLRSFEHHPWMGVVPTALSTPVETGSPPILRRAVSVLNQQSACPLAAFLIHRLGAEMPGAPEPFTDASFRGVLVHAALHELYRNDRSNPQPGDEQVALAVQEAFHRHFAEQRMLPAVCVAERHLVEDMIRKWLARENDLDRGEVSHLEWRSNLRIAGFEVEVQIDRIDRLADGRVVLLDYKTGALPSTSPWGNVRIGDVQLPLYATLLKKIPDLQPAGIAFASVRVHEARIRGIGDEPADAGYALEGFSDKPRNLARVLGSWEGALEHWEARISALLEEFMAGDSSHRIHDARALEYSGLHGLMRSAESQHWLDERGAGDRE